ncbi:MFS transporter [Ferroacidibacillus organovorans]
MGRKGGGILRFFFLKRLSADARRLVGSNTLFIAGLGLSATFINVYLWRVDHSLFPLILFNGFLDVGIPLAFVICGFLAHRVKEPTLLRIGIIGVSVFFALLLFAGKAAAHHAIWLGLLFGLGQGFYWYAFHVASFDCTRADARTDFHAASGFFTSLVGMLAPFVAGLIIANSARLTGYSLVFACTFTLFVILFVQSFRLRHGPCRRTEFAEGFCFARDPDWRRVWLATVSFGLREGVYAFVIPILVFFSSKTEAGVGDFGLWTGIVALLSYGWIGRIKRHELLKRFMIVPSIALGGFACVLLLGIKPMILTIFGASTALLFPFVMIPLTSVTQDEIDESERSSVRRAEYVISREVALGVGRVSGILLLFIFLAIFPGVHGVLIVSSILGFAYVLTSVLIAKVTYTDRRLGPMR